jgi:ferredoxin
MKVSIDKEKCSLCATCVAICPEVFELKDDGSVDVKDEYKSVDVPAELEGKVKEAQSSCPSMAIVVEE